LEAREKHASSKGGLSTTGKIGINQSRRGLKQKVDEDAGMSFTRQLIRRAFERVGSTHRNPGDDGD
jgi:hypothetical protein